MEHDWQPQFDEDGDNILNYVCAECGLTSPLGDTRPDGPCEA